MIKGWQKTSFIDYPDEIASTVFTGGCNFHCPFCHNKDLVVDYQSLDTISLEDILSHLKVRKNVLTGVCITGGEPTLQKKLLPFMEELKEMGFLVKLDTNGYHPEKLQEVILNGYVDYIAMDIKNSPEKYAETVGLNIIDLSRIDMSIDLIVNSAVSYEFRTTVIKEFHANDDLVTIGKWLQGSRKYCIQQFHPSEKQIVSGFTSYDPSVLTAFRDLVHPFFDSVEIKGL